MMMSAWGSTAARPPSSVADESEAGRLGGSGGGGAWAQPSSSASPAGWRTSAPLLARAAATPRGSDLNTLLAAVGEDGAAPPSLPPEPTRPARPRAPWAARLGNGVSEAGRDALQVAVGMALAAVPSVLGPGWSPAFPAACTAPTFLLIAMLQMSPSAAVGVRLTNVASLLGPAALGCLAGGGAASLAALAAGPGGGGALFTAVLALAAAPILAAAAVVRGAQHAPPYVAGMGLVLALAAGSTMLGAASTLAAARSAVTSMADAHQHWWATVTPTLAAFGVAGGATVVASLLFPALASTDVEKVTARALAGCGEALSSTAARLFAVAADPGLLARSASTGAPLPPAGAGAAALPPVSLDDAGVVHTDGSGNGALLMEREPVDAPDFEAWWARLCAPVDTGGAVPTANPSGRAAHGLGSTSLTGRLMESVLSRRWPGKAGEPTPLPPPADGKDGANGHHPHHHPPSLADPGPPVSSLRPLLAAARAALASSVAEPPILRGWRARPFCGAAWERLLSAIDALVTALSALAAVAGDDTALSETRRLYPPALEGKIRGALAAAAACLARLAARVEGEAEAEAGGCGSGGPLPPSPAAAGTPAAEDWEGLLAGLRSAMDESVSGYVSRARSARPGSPVVLPSAYTARSHAFAFVAAASVVARVADVDAAAAGALGCGCPTTVHRHGGGGGGDHSHSQPAAPPALAWVVGLAKIALCVPVWQATARAARAGVRKVRRAVVDAAAAVRLGGAVPETPRGGPSRHRRRRPWPRPWRTAVASTKYFFTVWVALTATLVAIAGSPALARLGPVAGFTAAALTASDKVEATLMKTLLWAAGTVVGGLVGGGLATIPGLPPPALAAILTACAGLVGAGARAGWRTAATLTLLTLSSIALCDASGTAGAAACAARGRTASPWCGLAGGPGAAPVSVWVSVVGRMSSVLAGVALAQAVCVLIFPWYVSDWALASISAAVRDGAEPFLENQARRFVAGGRDAWVAAAAARGQAVEEEEAPGGDDEEAPRQALRPVYGLVPEMPDPLPPAGLNPLPLLDPRGRVVLPADADSGDGDGNPAATAALGACLAAPLVDVQSNLARDATAWSRGVLATPAAVRVVLKSALSLLDALAALAFALDPAILGGGGRPGSAGDAAPAASRLTGVLYEAYTVPTFPHFLAVFGALRKLVDAVTLHAVTVRPHRAGWLEYCGPTTTTAGGGGGGGVDGEAAPVPATPRRRRVARSRVAVEAALADLAAARKASIAAQAAARRTYHAAMVAGGSGDMFVAPVDILRHLAFTGALIKASNRMMGVANAVLAVQPV